MKICVCGWAQPVRRAPPAVVSILSATPVDAAQIPSSTSGSSQHTNPAGYFSGAGGAAEQVVIKCLDKAVVGTAVSSKVFIGAQDAREHVLGAAAKRQEVQPTLQAAGVRIASQELLIVAVDERRVMLH